MLSDTCTEAAMLTDAARTAEEGLQISKLLYRTMGRFVHDIASNCNKNPFASVLYID
jgi:hypothetical protein